MIELLALMMAYRVRGGGYNLGGAFKARIFWGIVLASCLAMTQYGLAVYAMQFALIVALAVLSMVIVGHSAYQGMWFSDPSAYNTAGKSHEWIGEWLPKYDDARPMWQNIAIASIGFTLVGAFRAGLVFAPVLIFQPVHYILACLLCGILHPLAYLAGLMLPFPNQPLAYSRDGEWKVEQNDTGANCEMLCGLAYGLPIVLFF